MLIADSCEKVRHMKRLFVSMFILIFFANSTFAEDEYPEKYICIGESIGRTLFSNGDLNKQLKPEDYKYVLSLKSIIMGQGKYVGSVKLIDRSENIYDCVDNFPNPNINCSSIFVSDRFLYSYVTKRFMLNIVGDYLVSEKYDSTKSALIVVGKCNRI